MKKHHLKFLFLGLAATSLTLGAITVSASRNINQAKADSYTYSKVTTAKSDWSGEYLFVYENGSVILDGSLTSIDVSGNKQAVTISNHTIEGDYSAYTFTIASKSNGYSIKSSSGYYIGNNKTSNELLSSKSDSYTNTISLDDDANIIVKGSSTQLQCYSGNRFRFYASTQQAIQLYEISSSVTLDSISIKTPASKLSYNEGESFDPSGTVLQANYTDGSVEEIASDYTYAPTGALSAGDTSIIYTYNNKTVSQSITVVSLVSLSMEGTLVTTTYNAKTTFDPTGLTIYANYSDGSKVDVTSDVVWGELVKGETSVTGTYSGLSITVTGLTINGSLAYSKVTDASSLMAGDKLIFVNEAKNKGAGTYVKSGATKSYFKASDVTISNGFITDVDNLTVFTLGGETGAWTISFVQGELVATSMTNQNMTVYSSTYVNKYWSIQITDGAATIKNTKYNAYLMSNTSDCRFTTYSGSQTKFQLYRIGGLTSDIAINNITASSSASRVVLDGSITASATVTGGEDADLRVAWTASPARSVSFSSDTTDSNESVTITGLVAGETTITATSLGDNTKKATFTINVIDTNQIESISLNKKQAAILHGNSSYTGLSVTALPEEAVNKSVKWTSSDSSIASVDNSGIVTSYDKTGLVTITATSQVDDTKKDSCELFVFSQKGYTNEAPLSVADVILAAENNIWPYDLDENLEQKEIFSYYVKGTINKVTSSWSGSSVSLSLIDEDTNRTVSFDKMTEGAGDASSIKVGSCTTIWFPYDSVKAKDGEFTVSDATCEAVEEGTSTLEAISINGVDSVKAGQQVTLSPIYTPTYTVQTGVTWTSSDESVATITSEGVLTAIKAGSTTITATSTVNTAIKGTLNITVTAANSVAGTYTLYNNGTGDYSTSITSSNITSYINGIDTNIFTVTSVSDIGVGYAPDTTDINFAANSSLGLTLNDTDYIISKVVVKGAHVNKTSDDASLECASMYYVPTTNDSTCIYLPFSYDFTLESCDYRTFVESISISVIAYDDATAIEETYAQAFLDMTTSDCAALKGLSDQTWWNCKNGFNNLTTYDATMAAAVSGALANEAGSVIEQCIARYDFIVGKYTSLENFMSRTVASNRINLVTKDTNMLYIVLIAGVTAVSAVAIYFIFRRKKIQK